jgi:hypothetical protein
MPPTYPISADVIASQPTALQHYNNLRADALRFGAVAADAVNLGAALARYADAITLQPLATDRLRIPWTALRPPTIVIDGYLCQAAANVDIAANTFTGVAATWYIFATHTAASTTFTLTANTSASESTGNRRIASINWNGTHLDYFTLQTLIPPAPTPPAVRAYNSAAISCGASAWTLMTLNSEIFDTDTMHDNSSNTSRLTAFTAGVYIIVATIMWASCSGSQTRLQIRINANGSQAGGTLLAENCTYAAPQIQSQGAVGVTFLNAGDYVEMFAMQNAAGAVNVIADSAASSPILAAVRLF